MGDRASTQNWVDDPSTFSTALDDLKSDGCMLLVVGSTGGEASEAGCRRMLGDELLEDRRRLFVLTDTTPQGHHGVRATHTGNADQRAVVYRTRARSTTARVAQSSDVPTQTVKSGMAALADAVTDEIDALAPVSGYGAGQLRVCVDDLDDLIAAEDDVDVLEFVRALRSAVDEHDGMAHFHLGESVPAAPVNALLPEFDAVVEVAGEDEPRQRWHLRSASMTTDWLEL